MDFVYIVDARLQAQSSLLKFAGFFDYFIRIFLAPQLRFLFIPVKQKFHNIKNL
jgi:hypothetical protein